jgi:hypothetical protein
MWIQVLIVAGVFFILGIIFIAVRKGRFRSGGAVGNALQEFHAIFDPGARNAIEEKQKEHVREDQSGDPPKDGYYL